MQEYDRASKWLIGHHGDAILRMAGVTDFVSWKALPAELVQPRQLPDGMIEVVRPGKSEPEVFVLELATDPDARIADQALRDMTLVFLDRRELPEVLVLVLHPKGNLRAPGSAEVASPERWSGLRASWRAIELWTIPAEALLALDDPGVLPWVPLAKIDGPPEPILRECRDRIDNTAPEEERENLLAVIQVMLGLRYEDPKLFTLFGGRGAMIESPVLQRFLAEEMSESMARLLVRVLESRFGALGSSLATAILAIQDPTRLNDLMVVAANCRDLDAFQAELAR